MLDAGVDGILEPESREISATCEALLDPFERLKAARDYSLLLAGFFKVLEIELRRKIFDAFCRQMHRRTAAAIFKRPGTYSLLANEQGISLGEMLVVLNALSEVSAIKRGDVHERLKT